MNLARSPRIALLEELQRKRALSESRMETSQKEGTSGEARAVAGGGRVVDPCEGVVARQPGDSSASRAVHSTLEPVNAEEVGLVPAPALALAAPLPTGGGSEEPVPPSGARRRRITRPRRRAARPAAPPMLGAEHLLRELAADFAAAVIREYVLELVRKAGIA